MAPNRKWEEFFQHTAPPVREVVPDFKTAMQFKSDIRVTFGSQREVVPDFKTAPQDRFLKAGTSIAMKMEKRQRNHAMWAATPRGHIYLLTHSAACQAVLPRQAWKRHIHFLRSHGLSHRV